MRSTSIGACPLRARVDPRLLRFSAGATASVLAVVLLIVDVARPLGFGLLASQVAVFAFTAFVSFQWSLWAQIFARVIWPRIGAPAELEDARPPRFAQFVSFVFTALALTTLHSAPMSLATASPLSPSAWQPSTHPPGCVWAARPTI